MDDRYEAGRHEGDATAGSEGGASQASGGADVPGIPPVDPGRSRWEGVLTPEEVEYCRTHGIPLAYDCAQLGWVPAACIDADGVTPSPDVAPQKGGGGGDSLRELEAADRRHWARRVERAAWAAEPPVGVRPSGHGAAFDTGEFIFRPWTLADLPRYRELLGDPGVWEFLPEPYPEPFTDETARGLMEVGSLTFLHDVAAVIWNGRPVGQCLLRHDADEGGPRTGEVAYWLGREYWGRGLMSRILPLFTERCFREHPVDVIYAWIRRDHGASARVARTAGYRRDDFPLESRLAEALGRPGFERWFRLRSDRHP